MPVTPGQLDLEVRAALEGKKADRQAGHPCVCFQLELYLNIKDNHSVGIWVSRLP